MIDLRALVEREERAWLESIELASDAQGECLYKPGRVMQARICLALMGGEPYGDALTYGRAEVLVDWLTDDGGECRRANSFDVTPHKYAAGDGIIQDWANGHGEVGELTTTEWGGKLAAVWWRPHGADSLLCEYREGESGVWRDDDGWGGEVIVVGGEPIPNNQCSPPHRHRLMVPWVAAADRQLDLFGAAE